MNHNIKKRDLLMRVESVRMLSNGSAFMWLSPPEGERLGELYPGQFVNILVPSTPGVFLRRPISVCDVSDGKLAIFVKPQGKGSLRLTHCFPGDEMKVLLPLGNGFDTMKVNGTNLLVGGGVGMAPLLYLGRRLAEKGAEVEYLLGGATASDLEMTPLFERFGKVYFTTADGSMGTRGFVTDHDRLSGISPITRIFACGPTPMMKAVATLAATRKIPMQVSLENHMACGMGACLCCVQDTRDGHQCVCTAGPVFPAEEIKW